MSASERFQSAVGAFQSLAADFTPLRPLERDELFLELAASLNATRAARSTLTASTANRALPTPARTT